MQSTADRLTLLYRVSQTFNSSLDLTEVLNSVMDEVIAATRAERGFLMLRDADGSLVFCAARGLDRQTIEAPEFQVSRGLVERVASEGQPRLTRDAQSDKWLGPRTSVMNLNLRSILCAPLKLKDRVLGVIYVDNRLRAGIFTQDDLELLSAIAASATVAIENARLYQVAVDKGRLERELQVAREVQASLLPRRMPQLPGWEFAALWQPAREVAGDFYDFIHTEAGQLGMVIADVTDKGMPAALFMALARSTVRASLVQTSSPADGMAHANRLLCADSANSMFVTLFYAQIEPATGDVVYVNAGHNPPLLYQAESKQWLKLGRTGMVLGVDEAQQYGQRAIQLHSGDFLFLYTDGVTEAINAQEQEFGEARIRHILSLNCQLDAGAIMVALDQALRDFSGSTAPFDDVTAVIVKRL
jgi:sigma-B regulation protein RsbU (phosphoserine phosphatase)